MLTDKRRFFYFCVFLTEGKILHLEVSFQNMWKPSVAAWKTKTRDSLALGVLPWHWPPTGLLRGFQGSEATPQARQPSLPKARKGGCPLLPLVAFHCPVVAVWSISLRLLKWGPKKTLWQANSLPLGRKPLGLTGTWRSKYSSRKYHSMIPLQITQEKVPSLK